VLETTRATRELPEIRLKISAILDIADARGWTTDREIAHGFGTSAPNLSRLLREDDPQAPGRLFIATVLHRFPDKTFDDFFEVVGPKRVRKRHDRAA
jgi:hypothetical protein